MSRQDGTTDKRPLTIKFFLPQGEPRGVRIAHITSEMRQAVLVPRSMLAEAAKREEIHWMGVYFLFGEPEDLAKPAVYIGQAEDCLGRIKQHEHDAIKDFWHTAVAIVSKSLEHSFTKADVTYLEWYCIKKAKEVNRFALVSPSSGSETHVDDGMRADLMHDFDTLNILTSAMGFPLFEAGPQATSDNVFVLTSTDKLWDGQGQPVEDGFTVFAGSKARTLLLGGTPKWVKAARDKFLDSGVLTETEDGTQLIFKEDYTFKTPSSAAAFLIGGAADGLRQWKSKSGETLGDQLKRASDDSGQCICLPG